MITPGGEWYDVSEFTPPGLTNANDFSTKSFIKDNIMVVNSDKIDESIFIYKKIENSWILQTEITKPPGAITFGNYLLPLEDTFLVDTDKWQRTYAEYSLSTYTATGTTFTFPTTTALEARSSGNVIVVSAYTTNELLIYENLSLVQTFPLPLDVDDYMALYNVRGDTIACLVINGPLSLTTTYRKIIVIKRVGGTWTFDTNIIDTLGPGSRNSKVLDNPLELFENTIIYGDARNQLVVIENGVVTNRLRPSELTGTTGFVQSCSIYGKYIVVSTESAFGYKAYVYEKTNPWNLIQTITSPNYTSGLKAYNRVYLTKDDLLVSSSKIDSTGNSFLMMFTFYPTVIKPPTSDSAGDGTGAVLSLHAIGKQDTFLNGKDGTFWKQDNVQHTNFTRFQKVHTYNNNSGTDTNWPFGNRITFQIDPKTSGDIMSNMYIKLTMPGLPTGNTYCDQLGRAVIKEASLSIGGTTIETLEDDWYIIHDELYASLSEQSAYKDILNGGQDITQLPGSSVCQNPLPLYIPLGFFFCRTHETLPGSWDNNVSTDSGQGGNNGDAIFRPYLYTCACLSDIISVTIEFNPVTFFSNVASDHTMSLSKVSLVTEEMVLTDVERNYLMSNKQQYIIPTVQKQPVHRLDKDAGVINATTSVSTGSVPYFSNQLVGLPPVKAFHWFMRNQKVEDDTDSFEFLHRFNFSSNLASNAYQENLYQIMSDARLYLNGHDRLGFLGTSDRSRVTGANYFKHVQPYQHGLTTPLRNIYTYSFALLPKNPQPTGSVDFSSLTSSKTTLDGSLLDTVTEPGNFNKYNMHLYYTGFKFMVYENNRAGLLFA